MRNKTSRIGYIERYKVLKLLLLEIHSVGWREDYSSRYSFQHSRIFLQHLFSLHYCEENMVITPDIPQWNADIVDNRVVLDTFSNNNNVSSLESYEWYVEGASCITDIVERVVSRNASLRGLCGEVETELNEFLTDISNRVQLFKDASVYRKLKKHTVSRMWEALIRCFLVNYLCNFVGIDKNSALADARKLTRYAILGAEDKFNKYIEIHGVTSVHGGVDGEQHKPHLATIMSYLTMNLQKAILLKGTVEFHTDGAVDVIEMQDCSYGEVQDCKKVITRLAKKYGLEELCHKLQSGEDDPVRHVCTSRFLFVAYPLSEAKVRLCCCRIVEP